MGTFRRFVRSDDRSFRLREAEAAPSGGVPTPPTDPQNTTNKHHFDMLQQQLGMEDEELQAAIESGSMQLWKVPDYSAKWGFIVSPPVNATIEQTGSGDYKVTFQLREKKRMDPKSFLLSYGDGETPNYYDGPIEDQTEIMTQEELSDLIVPPLQGMGGAPMGMMGGGMPPMGGAMGGMGGPPMGGM